MRYEEEMRGEIGKLAQTAFAKHRMRRADSRSWRVASPASGLYAYRVTWAVGSITVTGDIGSTVYTVWPAFATPWGAAELINAASHDYLINKSTSKTGYNQTATAATILRRADQDAAGGDNDLWDRLITEYALSPSDEDREELKREAAEGLREDADLTPERAQDLFGDYCEPVYTHPYGACWQYEAVKLWAAQMIANEPMWHRVWHRVWRWGVRQGRGLNGYRMRPVIWRPDVWEPAKGGAFNGDKYWQRVERPGEGYTSFYSISRWRLLGLDLSRIGCWRRQGSHWPSRSGEPCPFAPLRREVTAVPSKPEGGG